MTRTWEDNAAEFGALTKQGKDVRLALLVACSVEKGTAGRPPKTEVIDAIASITKVSAREFAKAAGTTSDRILRHLEAWEKLADTGLVPYAADLTPDDVNRVEISDEALAAWEEIGLGPTTKSAIEGNPSAVAALLKENKGFAAKVLTREGVAGAVSEVMAEEELVVGAEEATAEEIIERIASDPSLQTAIAEDHRAGATIGAKAIKTEAGRKAVAGALVEEARKEAAANLQSKGVYKVAETHGGKSAAASASTHTGITNWQDDILLAAYHLGEALRKWESTTIKDEVTVGDLVSVIDPLITSETKASVLRGEVIARKIAIETSASV